MSMLALNRIPILLKLSTKKKTISFAYVLNEFFFVCCCCCLLLAFHQWKAWILITKAWIFVWMLKLCAKLSWFAILHLILVVWTIDRATRTTKNIANFSKKEIIRILIGWMSGRAIAIDGHWRGPKHDQTHLAWIFDPKITKFARTFDRDFFSEVKYKFDSEHP